MGMGMGGGGGGGGGWQQAVMGILGLGSVYPILNDVFSKDPKKPVYNFTSPTQGALLNLFGISTAYDPNTGGWFMAAPRLAGELQAKGHAFPFANPIDDIQGKLARMFDPGRTDPLQDRAKAIAMGDYSGVPEFQSVLDLYDQSLIPRATSIAMGERPSIDAAVNLSTNIFENEFLPAASERSAGLGLGNRSSDFEAAIAREASRRSAELGALDIDLQSQALNRSLDALPLAGLLAMSRAEAPLGFASDMFNTGTNFRNAEYNILAPMLGMPVQSLLYPQNWLMSNKDLFRRNFAGTSGNEMGAMMAQQAGNFYDSAFGGGMSAATGGGTGDYGSMFGGSS